MWSWGLGCIRTKGSSTETSLGRERGSVGTTVEPGETTATRTPNPGEGEGQHGDHHGAGGNQHDAHPWLPHHTHPPRDTTSFTLTL